MNMSVYEYVTNVSKNSCCIYVNLYVYLHLCLRMSVDDGMGDMGQERLNTLVSIRHMSLQQEESCFFCQNEEVTFKHDTR